MSDVTQRIVPNIWCNRNAEEVGQFYAKALPDTTTTVEARYPTEGLLDFQQPLAGQPLTVVVDIAGTRFVLINAGPEFRPTAALSFMLNFDARDALDATWNALAEGGTVRMELGTYPFSERYGWVEDQYGVNWQLSLADPSGEKRPFVMPALMFGGDVQDKAREAADFYVSQFASTPGGAEVGSQFPYGTPSGPAGADALAYGEFRVGDQWLSTMDYGADTGEADAFTEGVSLEVICEDQETIDRLWEAMSAVPEAEQCGWLKDKYGVSWQITPAGLGELMERPDAFEHLMGMKKLVIDDF